MVATPSSSPMTPNCGSSSPANLAIRTCVSLGGAITTDALGVLLDRRPQGASVDVGPGNVTEHQLGVGGLPDQEVAGAQLAGRAPEQVDVGHVGLVEVARERARGDPGRIDAPGLGVAGQCRGGVGDL